MRSRGLDPAACKRKGFNMRTLVTCVALLGLVGLAATPAQADRRLTREEKSSLRSAMKDMGCSGGKMEVDNGKFEVDDAKCRGKRYDLTFDQNFKLTNKEFEGSAGRNGYYGSGRYDRRDSWRDNKRDSWRDNSRGMDRY
ncbi:MULTISPECIES: PepSY domain-containing protein [unclassified Methylocystis]|jgi:hypothetical protein|uniref:PepSY domain-containing protein n=1 Tax=unclassified Methylocystis TaxID=2625913 RepID=UPI001FEDB680|nr:MULTISPECIES: PepSY domain-containing protein [unclassified Methylocystis]